MSQRQPPPKPEEEKKKAAAPPPPTEGGEPKKKKTVAVVAQEDDKNKGAAAPLEGNKDKEQEREKRKSRRHLAEENKDGEKRSRPPPTEEEKERRRTLHEEKKKAAAAGGAPEKVPGAPEKAAGAPEKAAPAGRPAEDKQKAAAAAAPEADKKKAAAAVATEADKKKEAGPTDEEKERERLRRKEEKKRKEEQRKTLPMKTASEVARGQYTIGELIDLALCSPEVGAVNFNILRMCLREMTITLDICGEAAYVNDVEANQVEKFRTFVEGTATGGNTPMPGVLKIGPDSNIARAEAAPAGGYGVGGSGGLPNIAGTSTTPSAREREMDRDDTDRDRDRERIRAARTPRPHHLQVLTPSSNSDLVEKVTRLEKHLEALYQLPSNTELLERAKTGAGGEMSVNDMWQMIQLNNRIAATEAAIQKMASLIEDLAKSMGKVKHENKALRNAANDLTLNKSDLELQGLELSEKCEKFGEVVDNLQKDMNLIKRGLKKQGEHLKKQMGTAPSFMKGAKTTTDEDSEPEPPEPDVEKEKPKPKAKPKKPKQTEQGTGTDEPITETEVETEAESPSRSPKPKKKPKPKAVEVETDEEEASQFERGTQTFVSSKEAEIKKPERKRKAPDEMIAPEDILKMTPSDIALQLTIEELKTITQDIYKQLTPAQKKAMDKIRKAYKAEKERRKAAPAAPLGLISMNKEQLQEIPAEKILSQLSYDEAVGLTPELIDHLSDEQKDAIRKVIQKGQLKRQQKQQEPEEPQRRKTDPKVLEQLSAEQVQDIPPAEIAADMDYEEAKEMPEKVLKKMTTAQKAAVKKVVEQGKRKKGNLGVAQMSTNKLEALSPETILAEMSYNEAASLSPMLARLSPEQRKAVQDVLDRGPGSAGYEDEEEGEVEEEDGEVDAVFGYQSPPHSSRASKSSKRSSAPRRSQLVEDKILDIARIPAAELRAHLTPEEAAKIPRDKLEEFFSPNQIMEIEDIRDRKKSRLLEKLEEKEEFKEPVYDEDPTTTATDYIETEEEEEEGRTKRKSYKDRPRKEPTRHHKGKKDNKDRKHRHRDEDKHAHVDVVHGPMPTAGEPLPPITLEEYLGSLPPEEAANLAADAVQRELQKQYQHLQGMQRQLAGDIQEKMEYIYQKLLKEIATNQMTTSPYMSVGGPEECLGPGICTGHGMPAGIAVVQFPDAKGKKATHPGMEGKVCPGPGICPGSSVCPYCRADAKQDDALHALRGPQRKPGGEDGRLAARLTLGGTAMDPDGILLQEMKSLILLDLEKIREEMRSKQVGVYDEQDILERLNAIWEALKILKYNEEAIAIKIARQDAFFKKMPLKTIEKLHKIPDENLDALINGSLPKSMHATGDEHRRSADQNNFFQTGTLKTLTGADNNDIQTLFNNMANVIAESAEHTEKINQLFEMSKNMDHGMVTKQMLMDALSDKADKGLINTKVSYDEFGNTIDELHTQLHNLMIEGYQRNENWKKVTSDLAEDLAEKLDKVELAPIRAFFKSHLKALEDKVKSLTDLVEEPDSAGTRKKLLRDYNCISCDRVVNISGVTNGPTLPTIGPIPAGHTTASKRALDLHRMRMLKQIDPSSKNLNALERQRRGIGGRQKGGPNPAEIANDMDVMDVVNRYTGGSHTNITNADLIAANRRKSNFNAPPGAGGAAVEGRKSKDAVGAELEGGTAPPTGETGYTDEGLEYMLEE